MTKPRISDIPCAIPLMEETNIEASRESISSCFAAWNQADIIYMEKLNKMTKEELIQEIFGWRKNYYDTFDY